MLTSIFIYLAIGVAYFIAHARECGHCSRGLELIAKLVWRVGLESAYFILGWPIQVVTYIGAWFDKREPMRKGVATIDMGAVDGRSAADIVQEFAKKAGVDPARVQVFEIEQGPNESDEDFRNRAHAEIQKDIARRMERQGREL